MARRRKVGNLLALALLGLLAPGQPTHPYEMATLLRRTGKEQDFAIKWGSLYTVVQNLEKHGFIEATGSSREGKRPERTAYAITEAGRAELRDWLRELLGTPERELPRFKAALSIVGVLHPDEVRELLARRVTALDDAMAREREALRRCGTDVPRIFLIEAEYDLAMREAEVAWVRRLLAEFDAGTLPGLDMWRAYHEHGTVPEMWNTLLDEGGMPGS